MAWNEYHQHQLLLPKITSQVRRFPWRLPWLWAITGRTVLPLRTAKKEPSSDPMHNGPYSTLTLPSLHRPLDLSNYFYTVQIHIASICISANLHRDLPAKNRPIYANSDNAGWLHLVDDLLPNCFGESSRVVWWYRRITPPFLEVNPQKGRTQSHRLVPMAPTWPSDNASQHPLPG